MNSFGRIFRVSILGESHGAGIGIVIDGCPAGLALGLEDFTADLLRRQGLNLKGATPRKESDTPEFQSGIFNGHTTGAPIFLWFKNQDARSSDYEKIKDTPRPGHADFVAHKKFGAFEDYRGGGHFSGRLTVGLVSVGVIAKKLLDPIRVEAKVLEVGASQDIDSAVDGALKDGDSVGGILECKAINVPLGLGEPFFDSVESVLSHAVFSIPAIKGIEFGAGFAGAGMRGSMFNDDIMDSSGKTATNNSGGINGGITNGNDLVFRVAVKPTSSIRLPKQTVSLSTGESKTVSVEGRHDACIALRVPVVLEAVTALVLADFMMISGGTRSVGSF